MDIKAALHQESNHTVQCNVDISTVSTAFLNFDSSECFWASGRGVGDILTSRSSHKILSSKNRARMKDRLMCWCPLFFFCHFFFFFPRLDVTLSPRPRDDNFSDTLSQKADSEASSGHTGEDRCSGKDMASPTDTRISEAYITRLVWSVEVQVPCDLWNHSFSSHPRDDHHIKHDWDLMRLNRSA